MRKLRRFDWFCDVAETFWENNVLFGGNRVILVEALSQDLRVSLRNLTVANALRRVEPARLVVFSGADDDWNTVVWSYFDLDEISRLARAYGAADVFDVHRVVDDRVRGIAVDVVVAGVSLGGDLHEAMVPRDRLDHIGYATTCRMLKVARLEDNPEHSAARARVQTRSAEFAKVFETLFSNLEVVALVSSHVDYDSFGIPVEAALRHRVPVIFPQSTGGLKAYALFPEHQQEGCVRAGLTEEVGKFFNAHIWPNRDLLRRGTELAAWRGKMGLGLPAWWRANSNVSRIDIQNGAERGELRQYAARRIGVDSSKPTIGVFNHAVSDALGTNVEVFADLGQWFEETAEYARERPEVNWLFLEHPQQALYDGSDFFGRVARRFAREAHMVFMPSAALSKNFVTSLTDLALTVRGSVANEFPAIGIPAIQCGWSDWSACGFTTVVATAEQYFTVLGEHIDGLRAGDRCITAEQVERARLWSWFYRSAADVSSLLVPPWQVGENNTLFDLLAVNMGQVEPDGDPAFVSVRRMWERRDPLLTRFDWQIPLDQLAASLAPVGAP